MEKICEITQEAIALGSEFSTEQEKHLLICQKCQLLFEEYQSLNLLISASSDVEVPQGFADAVIEKIETQGQSVNTDWMARFLNIFERAMMVPQVQYVALGLGSAVSVLALVRFVFFVLIPVG